MTDYQRWSKQPLLLLATIFLLVSHVSCVAQQDGVGSNSVGSSSPGYTLGNITGQNRNYTFGPSISQSLGSAEKMNKSEGWFLNHTYEDHYIPHVQAEPPKVRVHPHTHKHAHTQTHARTNILTHTLIHTHTHALTHSHTTERHIHAHNIHIYTRTRTYTHTHTHKHTATEWHIHTHITHYSYFHSSPSTSSSSCRSSL